MLINKACTHLFLLEDDSPQQLVLQTFHVDCEINDRCPGTDFWGVCWVRQFGGYIQPETVHYTYLFVSDFNLNQDGSKKPRVETFL